LTRRPHTEFSVFAALFGAQTFFGAFPVVGKVALATIPPLPFALFRVAGASAILWIARAFSTGERVERGDRGRMIMMGILGVSINQIFYITGLSLSTAINAALLMTTVPVFTLTLAILHRHESLTRAKLFGCLLGLAGALILVGIERFDWRSSLFVGDVLLLINAAAYSLYLVHSRDLLKKYSAMTFIRYTFTAGAVPIALLAAVPLDRMQFSRVTPTAWVCLAFVIVFASVVGYVLNAWALGRTEATRVAIFLTLQPAVATTLSIVWLHEYPTVKTAIAASFIIGGLILCRPPVPRRAL
jgi:drug/metabolite transporter (DMT)-like permease